MSEKYLDIERVARGYNIKPVDVLDLISSGDLSAIKNEDGSFCIALSEYQKMGKSFPPALTKKIMQNLWEETIKVRPEVQKEVRDRFLENSGLIIDRCEQAIKILETIHKKHDVDVDIFHNKDGYVASYVVYARIISMLNSVALLLRKGVPTEAIILFRPLWEAILLANYFSTSEKFNENQAQIRKWFNKEELVSARDVREYLSKRRGFSIEVLRKLNNGYSSFLHHSYKSIMESYRSHTMQGFGHKFIERQGFDYHQTSLGRDLVSIVEAFENLINPSLSFFLISFSDFLPLSESDIIQIREELNFYSLSFDERMKQTFSV